jgi:hypothetical protein
VDVVGWRIETFEDEDDYEDDYESGHAMRASST